MSKYMRTALLVAVGVACVAVAAFASTPDPTQSTCPPALVTEPGDAPANGSIDFVVNVKNGGGINLVGSNVVVDFGVNLIAYCQLDGSTLNGVTRTGNTLAGVTGSGLDAGNAHMWIKGGLCGTAGVTRIYADGVQICSYNVVATVDFDGNGAVNVSDLGSWAGTQSANPQDVCGDYDGNGAVNVADLGLFAAGQAAGSC